MTKQDIDIITKAIASELQADMTTQLLDCNPAMEAVSIDNPELPQVLEASMFLLSKLVPSVVRAVLQAAKDGNLGQDYSYVVAVDVLAHSVLQEAQQVLEAMNQESAAKGEEETYEPGDAEDMACQTLEDAEVVEEIQQRVAEICRENSGK